MKRIAFALGLVGSLAAPLAAQDSTAALLRQARRFYEQLEVERALPLLRQIISPSWPFDVTPGQRVEAFKYLGTSLVLIGKRDSAVFYFQAALARDAFTDLDPALFTPAQLAVFAQARTLTFAVAARPVAAARFDPRMERMSFTVATTHTASLEVTLRALGAPAPARAVLFSGASQGLLPVEWNGLLDDGRLAPPGRYELVVVGRSALRDARDSARVYLVLGHDVEPLEDTLRDLTPSDLLPERRSPAQANGDLVGGLAVAISTLVIADGLASSELGGGLRTGSRIVAGLGLTTGGVAFFVRRRPHDLPENIAVNARRRTERLAANDAIARRNAERIARTVLVITPAAGMGP